MADQINNVMIIGAGGNIGRPILKALLDSGKFTVTVLSRAESKSTFPSEVKVVKTDYSDGSLAQVFKGQDALVCAVAGGAMDEQKRIIDKAVEAGVKRVIPSEFGSNTTNVTAREICFLFQAKYDIVQYLKAKADANPHFSWTAIVTGPFFDWCLAVGFLFFDLKTHTATIWDGGDVRFSTTNIAAVGKAVVGALANADRTKDRYIFTQSFCITQNQVLQALEKSTGKKWEVKHVKSADMIKDGKEKMSKGDLSGIALLIMGCILNGDVDVGGNLEKSEGIDNELVGLPKEEDLQATVDAIVRGEFTP